MDFLNKQTLFSYLDKLTPEKVPVFGMMTPQHMVEHLALVVQFSNGKRKSDLKKSGETAQKWKQALIYSDFQMQPGIKAPFLSEDKLLNLINSDLISAKIFLEKELDDFHSFFSDEPTKEIMHPALGPLNYEEWKIFHNKHFAHHFRQFELL